MTEAINFANYLDLATSYEYNAYNQQTKVVDPRGITRRWYYSAAGVLTLESTIKKGGNEDDALAATKYGYDDNGRRTLLLQAIETGTFDPRPQGSANWITTRYVYDQFGRQTNVIADAGGLNLTTQYEYDQQDQVTKTEPPGGVYSKSERDGRGLQIKQIVGYDDNSANELTTTYEYDENGNLTKTTGPGGMTTEYAYDGFDRRTRAIRS